MTNTSYSQNVILRRPWQHPGDSPIYILHEDEIQNMRERPSVKFVKLSINNHIVGLVHKHHIINEILEYRISTSNERV